MNTFKVAIYAADHVFYEGLCESLVVPTLDGQFGIQANHSNVISAVVPGELHYTAPGEETKYASVSSGLIKVEDNEVLVLVVSAERPEEIDANRARRQLEEAQSALLRKQSKVEYRVTQAHLSRAMNRLRVRGHAHGGMSNDVD